MANQTQNYTDRTQNDDDLDISDKKVILNEEEYNALVNENQEFMELLNVAKDQFNALQEKHVYLVDSLNNS